ncbi:inositol monophosphatase family protein [Clavibacter zhangzhiyongii]|uniref:inositol monophosphatase family protein n=1 Tax=Clavibacter TaxID=1573 RepID=UPI0039E19D77
MTAATAHRGDSSRHRENTLAALRSAAEAGAAVVEVDVRITRDDEAVLLHDATLERLWGADARVADLDLAEVRGLGGGATRIPLLAEALELLAGTDVELVIDMASGDPAAAAHAVVAAAPRAPRVAWCGHVDGMRTIRALDPHAVIWLPWADAVPPTAADLAELRPAVVNLPHLLVGPALVAAVHALGARVAAWTVDEPAQMAWLASIGVDAITTNELPLLLDVLARRAADASAADAAAVDPAAERRRARSVARDLAGWSVHRVRSHAVGDVATKANPADHVTEIDRAVERDVRAVIGAQFPHHVLVGEEYGGEAVPGRPCWYLDPVDGTANLANGVPWTSFSLALVVDGAPVVGVVADPWRGTLVEAAHGEGAWSDGRRLDLAATPHGVVAPAADPLRGRMVSTELAGHAPWPGMLPLLGALAERYCTLRIMGSGTLTVAGIALGHGAGAVIGQFGPVDHLAATLIVREAGGVVLDADGDDALFPASGGVLAARDRRTAEALHALWRDAIVAELAAAVPADTVAGLEAPALPEAPAA